MVSKFFLHIAQYFEDVKQYPNILTHFIQNTLNTHTEYSIHAQSTCTEAWFHFFFLGSVVGGVRKERGLFFPLFPFLALLSLFSLTFYLSFFLYFSFFSLFFFFHNLMNFSFTVFSLECWDCKSSINAACSDPFLEEPFAKMNCSANPKYEMIRNMYGNKTTQFCRKIVEKSKLNFQINYWNSKTANASIHRKLINIKSLPI